MKLPMFRRNQIFVKQFNNEENNSPITLLSFDGKIRDQIIERFNTNYLIDGSHIKNGGKSSPKSILTLIGAGAGSIGLAGATSGQLFMATANPATLMAIGNGVGSAVMGAGGIVAQAPFIPVAGALMPVVAPLIAFQIISTITIMNEFKVVNKKLDDIKFLIERIIIRDEATNLGIIISALNRIEDIEKQYETLKYFNTDMMNRLALLENSINPLFERYNYLYSSTGDTVVTSEIKYSDLKDAFGEAFFGGFYLYHMENRQTKKTNISEEDLKYKGMDAYFAILTSIVDIRVSLLRIKMNMQEAPEYVENSTVLFKEKVRFYEKLWETIHKDYENIKEISSKMEEAVKSMNWWQRTVPTWLGGKRKERIENEKNIQKLSPANDLYKNENGLRDIIEKSKQSVQYIGQTSKTNLLYWRDDIGEHSYFTDDLVINNIDVKSKHGT
jgi:hypothetical protein